MKASHSLHLPMRPAGFLLPALAALALASCAAPPSPPQDPLAGLSDQERRAAEAHANNLCLMANKPQGTAADQMAGIGDLAVGMDKGDPIKIIEAANAVARNKGCVSRNVPATPPAPQQQATIPPSPASQQQLAPSPSPPQSPPPPDPAQKPAPFVSPKEMSVSRPAVPPPPPASVIPAVNPGVDATLSTANRMFRDGMNGCTFVETALMLANHPGAFGPTASAQRKELKRYADRCNLSFQP